MTERLYYEDAYLTQFDAEVLEIREQDGRRFVRLNRSAFYPTSGGQPFDTGTLGGVRVLDVFADGEKEIWHEVEGPLEAGTRVAGRIDWERRFDHMQQHAGEHMLAGAIWRMLGGVTIGLHLGAEVSTIDVQMPNGEMRVPDEAIRALEDEVNREVQRDIPICCWFPDEAELEALPLRKPPAVREHVRIVAIGEEMVACGGTHPSSSGQIGLIKVLGAGPSKGKMRVSFVCGMRAFLNYRMHAIASEGAAQQLSAAVEHLPESVGRLLERVRTLEGEIVRIKRAAAFERMESLYEQAEALPDGWRVVAAELPGLDAFTLRDLASGLTAREKVVALLASAQEKGYLLVFARSEGCEVNVGALLSESARECGGKGGGKPDFAQGSAACAEVLNVAREKLLALTRKAERS